MSVVINSQVLELDGVTTVLVSDRQPDPDSDYYVRYVEIYTDPVGTPNRKPTIHLTMKGGSQQANDQSALLITLPNALTY